MKSIVILISGRGSNMEALLRAQLPARVAAVVSNNPAAEGIEIAARRGVETVVLDHREFPTREDFDTALLNRIEQFRPDLVVLAGFMRILTEPFVHRFHHRMINIHPSLLPAFPGTDTHRRALEQGVKLHGCTVHLVTSELDGGPIIAQAAVPVLDDDTQSSLAARVLAQEHRLLPAVVRWFLEDRLSLHGNRVRIARAPQNQSSLFAPSLA